MWDWNCEVLQSWMCYNDDHCEIFSLEKNIFLLNFRKNVKLMQKFLMLQSVWKCKVVILLVDTLNMMFLSLFKCVMSL